MSSSSSAVYLPIRAYGDFIIAASVVKDRIDNKIPIILPDYMVDFFTAIDGNKWFNVIGSIGYKNQPAFFELFRVKNIGGLLRLFADVKRLTTLNKKNQYLLDYSSKRISFTGLRFLWPDVKENAYAGKLALFKAKFDLHHDRSLKSIATHPYKEILILPDSRIQTKSIDTNLIATIKTTFNDLTFQVASFGKSEHPDRLIYSNFGELINLIKSYDLIISAESLPYHLAYFLNVPHFVVYKKSKHFKKTFMTPFMESNKYYATFDGNNHQVITMRLGEIFGNNQYNL